MPYDLKTGEYLLVRQHDSWLSVDPIAGCSYDCKYCILRASNLTRRKPQQVASIDEAIQAVTNYRYFVPETSVVSFGNNTDSFLPENVESTLTFIQKFRSRGYQNPIAIATKTPILETVALELGRKDFSPLLLFVSYSNLGHIVEGGVNHSHIRNNFRTLYEAGVTVLHFWRPLVKINGASEVISEILDLVSPYSRASVCIGLKYSPRLYEMFKETKELVLPSGLQGHSGNYLDEEIISRIVSIAEREHPQYPIYFRTSCAVAYVLGLNDYIAILGTEACASSRCPKEQRVICKSRSRIPCHEEIDSVLSRIGLSIPYTVTDEGIEFSDILMQGDYIFLLHNLRSTIHAQVTRTTEWKGHILP